MIPSLGMAAKRAVDVPICLRESFKRIGKVTPCLLAFFLQLFLLASLHAAGNEPPVAEVPIDLMAEGLEVAGYLILLMIFAAIMVRVGKRFQPRMGASGLIQIEDGHNLAPGVGVRLVRVGSRAWLVGVTRERVSLLAEMSVEEMRSAAKESTS
ncbi:MAG: FliO/MopB family protein [Magnetococcales bacterium]|nr:FliO/MopB family protein [Magnetococcales bacterium]